MRNSGRKTLVTRVIEVPLLVCSICSAEGTPVIYEARSWHSEGGEPFRGGVDMVARSYALPDGWWQSFGPLDLLACPRCTKRLQAGEEQLLERLRSEASEKR